jgi:hypothetical protein
VRSLDAKFKFFSGGKFEWLTYHCRQVSIIPTKTPPHLSITTFESIITFEKHQNYLVHSKSQTMLAIIPTDTTQPNTINYSPLLEEVDTWGLVCYH